MSPVKTKRVGKQPVPAPEADAVVGGPSQYVATGQGGQFVLLSDLHAHTWSAFAKGDGAQNSRLQHAVRILRESLERAAAMGVPWVFAGDLVHTAGYAFNVVLAELTKVFVQFPDVPKLIVWGNHDARGIGGRITLDQTVLASFVSTLPNFYVLDPTCTPVWMDPNTGLTYSGAGYQPRAELLELGAVADVGVYHQTVRGTLTPHNVPLLEGVDGKALLERHRVVVVGHVHHWQYHPSAIPEDKMLLIPGSPEHHNFGDAGEHGWWVVTISKRGVVDSQHILGNSPEFRTVDSVAEVVTGGAHYYRVRNVQAGEAVPTGAAVVAPVPTAVPSRDTLKGARGDAALEAWLKAAPPDGALIDPTRYLEVGRDLLPATEVGALRPMRLARLHLQDFGSYHDQVVDVSPGTWLVLGRGRDFPSNGAGKSTLFEAIFWVLFGRTTKGQSGDEVIRWGQDGCQVTAHFVSDTEELIVTRARGAYGNGLQVLDGGVPMEAKSAPELTAKLGQHLGLTPELYQALGYFSQERLLLFASATDGERKEMLGDLIGLAAYQEATSAAGKELAECEKALRANETAALTLQAQIASEEKRAADATERANAWAVSHAERIASAENEVVAFDARYDAAMVTETERLLERVRATYDARLQEQERKFNTALAQHDAIVVPALSAAYETAEARASLRNEYSLAMAAVHQDKGRVDAAKAARQALESRYARVEKQLSAGVCPSCQQAVGEEHRVACLAPLQEEMAAAEAAVRAAMEQQIQAGKIAAQLQGDVRWLDIAEAAIKQREAAAAEVQRAEQAIITLNADAQQRADEAAEQAAATLRVQREGFVRRVANVMSEKNPHAGEVVGAQSRITDLQEQVRGIEVDVGNVRKAAAIYAYWQKGFSKQGLQSLLVDEVARLFNDVRGAVFPALTQGIYDVQFSTMSQTKAGEWREKTEFQVFEKGVPVPYAALSGGQRRRVDVGVMLTLVQAVAEWMHVPGMLGLLILDEVFGFLDASGAEGLMEALREVQERIPSVFVVSHEPQLQALFPDTITVTQGADGISRILTEATL